MFLPPALVPAGDPAQRLAKRLRLVRPLAFIDLETTGISCQVDRIVEIAVVVVQPDGGVIRWNHLVQPGRPIPPEATTVHGIGDPDVRDAPRFEALAGELVRLLDGCDFGGYNVGRFDLKMLAAELARAGVPFDVSKSRVVDAMTIYHKNERRDLDAAVRFYCGRNHAGGHRASADIEATIEVLAAELDRYAGLPRDVEALADYCDGRQPDWLTSDGKIAWRDGAARLTFGKHAGKSLQTLATEEPAYLRWVTEQTFPADFKGVIEKALDGEFPSAP